MVFEVGMGEVEYARQDVKGKEEVGVPRYLGTFRKGKERMVSVGYWEGRSDCHVRLPYCSLRGGRGLLLQLKI